MKTINFLKHYLTWENIGIVLISYLGLLLALKLGLYIYRKKKLQLKVDSQINPQKIKLKEEVDLDSTNAYAPVPQKIGNMASLEVSKQIIVYFNHLDQLISANKKSKEVLEIKNKMLLNDFMSKNEIHIVGDEQFQMVRNNQYWFGFVMSLNYQGRSVKIIIFNPLNFVPGKIGSESSIFNSASNQKNCIKQILELVLKKQDYLFRNLNIKIELAGFTESLKSYPFDLEKVLSGLLDCVYYLIKDKKKIEKINIYPLKEDEKCGLAIQIHNFSIKENDFTQITYELGRKWSTIANTLDGIESEIKKSKGQLVIYNTYSSLNQSIAAIEAWFTPPKYTYSFRANKKSLPDAYLYQ